MKSISKDFRDFICTLAKEHKEVRHSDTECHFACSLDEANNKYATVMCYPCVALDCGDLTVIGNDSQKLVQREYTIFVLQHVADSADASAINEAYDQTESISLDFLARLDRCKTQPRTYPYLNRVDLLNSTLRRIEYEKAQLYGFAVSLRARNMFTNRDCDSVFIVESSEEENV